MGTEIERKFLVHGEPWKGLQGSRFVQGYLSTEAMRTVRVRTIGEQAYITIKACLENTLMRSEYEYEIPIAEANLILENLAQKPLIEKIRYNIIHEQNTWDLDVFLGENTGLVVAEIELNDINQTFTKPDWLGDEVTNDKKYLNSSLVTSPYFTWTKNHGT